jgi:glycosyltransferase involved in cell wall biosynthesis
MALDVPVLVSRQSGVSELLEHAVTFDFWDVDDLAEKILGLLRDPERRRALGERGRAEVTRMRWDLRGKLLRDLYEDLIA